MRPVRCATALLCSLVLVLVLVVVSGCGSAADSTSGATGSASLPVAASGSASAASAGSGATCSYPPDGSAAKAVTAPATTEPNSGTVTVDISLTGGDVKITMDRSKTPCTIGSFVHLAQVGYFADTKCHRLTTAASLKVLQCGDPSGTGSGGPGYSFADETNPSMTYPTGTVAMANAGPNTNGSQFFLVYADSTLNPNYTVFGTITGGLDVLTKIAAAGVSGGGQDGAPASPITITKVAVGS